MTTTLTIKVRYHDGKLEPLEPLDLAEGSELTLTVTAPEPSAPAGDPTAPVGAGKDGDLAH